MTIVDIVPISEGDASILTRIGYRAFADDLLNKRLYNLDNATPAHIEEDLNWRIKRNERRMFDAGGHWFKALERVTRKPVGYTGILAPEKGKQKALDVDATQWPATMNMELWAFIAEKGKELRKEHLGDRDDYWYVPSMAVDPDYHRRGIAKLLLQKACELADKAGQDVYLEGTVEALSLYKKAGFEVLGEVLLLDGEYRLTSMLRKPKTLSTYTEATQHSS